MATKTNDPRKAVGYIRVSTDEQHLGPEAQHAALTAWCARTGTELVAIHADHGVSGGAPLEDRPALLAAVAALKTHGAGVLLVAKRDRLARDHIVNGMIHDRVNRSGAQVCSADGHGNGDAPEAMLMARMVEAFGQYERSLIRARTRAALQVKKSRGERISREPAYGYRLNATRTHVEVDHHEQRVVGLVRTYRQEGLPLRDIGARLTAVGLRPRSGGTWNPKTIRNIAQSAER